MGDALDGLSRNLLGDPAFAEIVSRDLAGGEHRNPTDRLDYFTTAYLHRPEALREEVSAAGLAVEGLYVASPLSYARAASRGRQGDET